MYYPKRVKVINHQLFWPITQFLKNKRNVFLVMQSLLMIYEVKENYNKHLYFHSVQLIFFYTHLIYIIYVQFIHQNQPGFNTTMSIVHNTEHVQYFCSVDYITRKLCTWDSKSSSSTLYSLTALTKPPIICDHERGVASYYLEVGYRLHLKMKMLC